MAVVDFVIAFFADSPSLRSLALNHLQGNTLIWTPSIQGRKYREFVQGHGNSVLGMFQSARKNASDTLGRVAVLGFSEGGQGVGATLHCTDANTVDVAIVADGIHTQYTPLTHTINPANLGQYISFAKESISDGRPSVNPDGRVLAITHSSIKPTYASTTETAQVIWAEATKGMLPGDYENVDCGFDCQAAVLDQELSAVTWPDDDFPLGTKLPGKSIITNDGYTTVRPSAAETGFLPSAKFSWSGFADGWTVRQNANGLHIFGWSYPTPNGTKDPTGNRDHVFQAQMVLPYVTKKLLVDRWNPVCSTSGFEFEGEQVGPFGDSTSCSPGAGRTYSSSKASPLPNPYPFGVGYPARSGACPAPPPGQVIVGRPGDPCWVPGTAAGNGFPGAPVAAYEDALKATGLVGGAALGWWLAQKARKSWAKRRR